MVGASTNTADSNRYLDSNNRLSSAGAAQSLKYARPQDLPSYPTSGLPPNRQKQDAATAANLGWNNTAKIEPYKPQPSGAAATAATRGWGTTAPKQWQPEQSMSGARAAVLAAQRNKNLPAQGVTAPPPPAPKPAPSAWGNTAANLAVSNNKNVPAQGANAPLNASRPVPSNWGNTAANLAVSNSKAKRPGTATPPNTTFRPTDIDRHGSLMAATGAMANRRRADSAPKLAVRPSYPDQANARSNALRAAAQAQSNSLLPKPKAPTGGANPAVHMPRSKFGYSPNQQPTVDQKTREEALQSSAVAMAQQMYKMMEKNKNKDATAGAGAALGRNRSLSLSSGSEAAVQPMRFGGLHEQAERMAAMRMAEMHDEEAQAREFREYYAGHLGPPPGQSQQQNTNRFSLGKLFTRNRRNSDDSLEDDVETRKIRAQMAVFQSALSKVDASKRQSDREQLLLIAQRNVKKDLVEIDEKVYHKTGKATPQMQQNWQQQEIARQQQEQAQLHAQQQHDMRMQNFGRIDMGGGTYMDQEQVDEVARMNVQPVLHDMDVRNDLRHEQEVTRKLDEEERQRLAVLEKQREKDAKELEKDIKLQMKEQARARKEEEKLSRKQSRKGSRLSRFGSISRSTYKPAASSSPESSHVADAPPVLAPVAATAPINLPGESRESLHGGDGMHHMSGAVRTSTTDTERATRESLRSTHGEEIAALRMPTNPNEEKVAREANADMRNEIPVSATEFDPHFLPENQPRVTPFLSAKQDPIDKADVVAPATVDPQTLPKPLTVDITPAHNTTAYAAVPVATPPAQADVVAPATVEPQTLQKPLTGDITPAQNTTAYAAIPAATPPAQVLTKKNIDQKVGHTAGNNKFTSPISPTSPADGSPKEKRGVKGWLKKAFRRGSSADEDKAAAASKSGKRNSKISKEDPNGKGKGREISSPSAINSTMGKPNETSNIGSGEGNLARKATQPGSSSRPTTSAATSGPLDSHPDVHAVDRTIYDASPPGDQREAAIAYERDQEGARNGEEVEVDISDIDEELEMKGRRVGLEDASTVSMLSEGSMERKRRAEMEEEAKGGRRNSYLPKVESEAEIEKAAEREEARDGMGEVSPPKFPVDRAQSPARGTRFKEDV